MKDFREAAENHCVKHSIADFERGQAKTDFIYGCKHGYSEAMKEHREFYLQVRQFYRLVHQIGLRTFETDEQARLYIDSTTSIEKHLAAFTDHEQSELPFKD